MRIAHLSDLHLLDLEQVSPLRFLNKRLTGYVNLKLKRGHHHKPAPVEAAARALHEANVDHVVITGDVTNLALPREFERVQTLLERELDLPADRVSLVPGNHDAYTRGAVRSHRFRQYFGPFMTSDLPDFALTSGFPFVRLRGPLAIIGLSSAVARLPLVAAGRIGSEQLVQLRKLLDHPEVRARTPLLLKHHPAFAPSSSLKALVEGLSDRDAMLACLQHVEHGVLLHGHLHRRIHQVLPTRAGSLQSFGATSASLLSADPERMAGYNLYDFDDQGALQKASARRLVEGGGFEQADIPARSWI